MSGGGLMAGLTYSRETMLVPVMPTLHPAYLLRNPADKRLVWDDIKLVMQELGMRT